MLNFSGVAFIAVNYGSTRQACQLAEAFRGPAGFADRAALLLIDNTQGARATELQSALNNSALTSECVNPGDNLGYFGGARFGLSLLNDRGWHPKWLVVCNVDLSFDANRVCEQLLGFNDPEIGVVAPAIKSGLSGKQLNPYMRSRPSRIRMLAYKLIYATYPSAIAYEWLARLKARHASARESTASVPSGSSDIYAGHGSFIAFNQTYFLKGGTLDHPPFLFAEEISVAERAFSLGLRVVHIPSIEIVHEEHASVSRLPNRTLHRYIREATAYTYERFFSRRKS